MTGRPGRAGDGDAEWANEARIERDFIAASMQYLLRVVPGGGVRT